MFCSGVNVSVERWKISVEFKGATEPPVGF